MAHMSTSEERFWRYVDRTDDGCWLWTGYLNAQTGYGRFYPRGGPIVGAHRFMWEIQHGPIPSGMEVCHTCDVRPCVRPDHLFLGTRADNVRDMMAKGRGKAAKRLELAKFILHVIGDMPSHQLAREAGVSLMTAKRARRLAGLPKGNRWRTARAK